MNNNFFRFVLKIIVIFLGFKLFEHFNYSTLSFKNPWLDLVYFITIVIILFLLYREKASQRK